MTVNELTETLKAKGYKMAEYTMFKSNFIFQEVTYTDYIKDSKLAMSTKRVKGAGETEVVAIYSNFEEELNEMGIEVGTILK